MREVGAGFAVTCPLTGPGPKLWSSVAQTGWFAKCTVRGGLKFVWLTELSCENEENS